MKSAFWSQIPREATLNTCKKSGGFYVFFIWILDCTNSSLTMPPNGQKTTAIIAAGWLTWRRRPGWLVDKADSRENTHTQNDYKIVAPIPWDSNTDGSMKVLVVDTRAGKT